MIQSFNSWNMLTESTIAKGKDVMIDSSGKKHKVTYNVQSSTLFVMKVINDMDLIKDEKLTPVGVKGIVDYLNAEVPFTQAIGQITPIFFDKKFIVYTILKDGELFGRTKQKIQFSIQNKLGEDGNPLYPNLPQGTQFIDAKSFAILSAEASALVNVIGQTAKTATLPDPAPEDTDTKKEEGTPETKKERGKKFLYTMRTNSKLYLMEFTDVGAINSKTQDGTDPNGTVSYDSAGKKVLWNTTLDDAKSKDSTVAQAAGAPLFYDMEITNAQDKTFLEKMFTDTTFRNKVIDEYEKDFAGVELTAANLRKMLYYKDGNAIFNVPAEVAATAPTGPAQLSKEQIAAAVNTIEKARTT